ncbi:MAG TPA: DMT family transporter [Solirubrobacteraceae bacterium]
MTRTLAVLLGAGAGCLVGMQAPINARLGRTVGAVQAATVSFTVGTLVLLIALTVVNGGFGSLAHIGRAPWWALLGGLCGAIFVTIAIVTVRTLGASGLSAAAITGQLVVSVAIDRFGLLGIAKQPIGASRIAGLVLLAAGVALVVRK